jgi:hypothetical protein
MNKACHGEKRSDVAIQLLFPNGLPHPAERDSQ